VPTTATRDSERLSEELSQALVHGMGASYRPERVLLVDDLPRTRNMKIMRRVLRAVFEDKDPGDLSALANPEAIDHIRRRLEAP
jgi:acetyl-CoA synthetase